MDAPLIFTLLVALVFVFGFGMFWKESRRMQYPEAIYGVEDSIEFVWETLGEEKLGLKKSDVRRILEWEMHYLQQPHLWEEEEGIPIIGGEAAARYTQEAAFEAGYAYEPNQIFAVMDAQAAYLLAIGAVGDAVEQEE